MRSADGSREAQSTNGSGAPVKRSADVPAPGNNRARLRVPIDVSLTHSLARIGITPHAASILETAAARPHGMLLFCGPAGMGKTTAAQLVVAAQARPVVHWLGDLRLPEEIAAALAKAANAPVVTVTLRRLTRVATSSAPRDSAPALPDLLVVEILAPDGAAMTASLAEEARALVAAGMATDDDARFMVPGYV